MAAKQFLGTRYQSFKDDGTVNAAGWVYFYEPGTSTEKTTYSDSDLGTANASPVVLNSAGAADIWYDGDADVSVYDSTGTLVDSYSSINPATSSSTVESNLIANGSFEEGGSTTPSNWTRSTPPALGSSAQDLDSAHGLYSWKFTSGGNGAGNLITTDYFNVAEGRSFNVVWQMKSSAADVRNLVEVVWYDDDDAELSASSIYDNSTTNPTSWITKSAVATPVSSAVRAKLRLTGCHSSDATAGSTWFDGVQVTEAHISGMSIVAKEGTAVASATDCNIWNLGDGNTVHITGTTTIEDWGTAPRAGAWMRVIFDDALQLTYNATTNDLPGDTNVTTVANDSCIVYARSTSSYQIFDYTYSSGYNQGTFTPNLLFGGANVDMTYTTQVGKYTRIGNRVTFNIEITLSAAGSSTGSATISGLPFAAGIAFPCAFYLLSVAGTAGYYPTARVASGATTISLGNLDNSTGAIAAYTQAAFSGNETLTLSGTYTV